MNELMNRLSNFINFIVFICSLLLKTYKVEVFIETWWPSPETYIINLAPPLNHTSFGLGLHQWTVPSVHLLFDCLFIFYLYNEYVTIYQGSTF